ncbi:MarR family winged helix-turn-helix transcriptional regulator [Brevibacterium spongiae]|uniref:MarR family transcriptional regulator n=1 Tax=Brevibacterium spongiae TaxID=2909672 RepID=A0ABY5SS22_9MICO|nr:MarR family transcriptional regulator [Brevibacterium spongiae]UVI36701.1 MarR family transcriptional regulator [Brevibacterium spongiae]
MTHDRVEEYLKRAADAGLGTLDESRALGAVYRVSRLAEIFEHHQRTSLGYSQYSLEETEVLIVLLFGEGLNFTPKQLADAVFVSPANMTAKLSRLEEAGRVERTLNPSDRRSIVVKLTEQGRADATEAFQRLIAHADGVMSPLTDDEVAQFSGLLTKLLMANGDDAGDVAES